MTGTINVTACTQSGNCPSINELPSGDYAITGDWQGMEGVHEGGVETTVVVPAVVLLAFVEQLDEREAMPQTIMVDLTHDVTEDDIQRWRQTWYELAGKRTPVTVLPPPDDIRTARAELDRIAKAPGRCGHRLDAHACKMPTGHDGDHYDQYGWEWANNPEETTT